MKRAIPFLLFFLVLLIGFYLVPSIGPAWDEPDNIVSGFTNWDFFTRGLVSSVFLHRSKSISYLGNVIYTLDPSASHYPPVPNYIGMLFTHLRGQLGLVRVQQDVIVSFHLATVLFFGLMVVFVYRFGRLFGLSVWASVFAALVTFLYPTLFGHGLSNIKDTAQASLFTISLYYLVRSVVKEKGKDLVAGAVIWGLALATKFNAVYVPVIWFIWVVLSSGNKKISKILFSFLLMLAVGLVTAFVVWPYLWFDTVAHVGEVVTYFTSVGRGYRVTWDGVRYMVGTGKSLWWYPLAVFLYQTPIALLGIIGIGLIREMAEIGKKRAILLFLWIAIPLLRIFWPWSAFYDELRHFMEILPAMMLVGAIGLDWLFRRRKLTMVSLVVGIAIIAQLVFINWTYFPYSTGYYNAFARDPNGNFDRDIEALSIKEGMDYLHSHYPSVVVFAKIGLHLSWYYLSPGDGFRYDAQDATFVLLPNKVSHIRQADYEAELGNAFVLDHVIRRGDAIFGWIYKKNPS